MSMYSLKFPDMIGSNGVSFNLVADHEATVNNMKLILKSDRGSLFGDPYFGTELMKTIFALNGTIIKDLVIDDIYSALNEFIPQVQLTRKNIRVYQKGLEINADISYLNKLDYITDLYTFRLTQ